MAKDVSYKKVTTTTLNFKGDYVASDGSIVSPETGEAITLADLLKGFDGEFIEGSVKIKVSEELDENLESVE